VLRRHVLARKLCESRKPLRVLCWAGEEPKVDPVQELHLEMVDILDLHSSDIRPGLVCKRVVVQELVGENKGTGEESIFGAFACVHDLV